MTGCAKTTYQALLDDATASLYDTCDTPRIDAEVLLQHSIDKPLAWLIAYGDTIATTEHITTFYNYISRRQQGEPVAYLLGWRDFWTLHLHVNKHVLIPRPDTETVIEQALSILPTGKPQDILDLGTGSGAIALSLAKERPLARVVAIDSQQTALDTAILNAEQNNITNVNFINSDWFTQLTEQQFDLIVSNPPYIDANDPHLQRGDLRFEPMSALIANNNGLRDIETIINQATTFLKPSGWLAVEHGYNQASDVETLFSQAGFKNLRMHKDLNELPRCTLAQRGTH